MREHISELLPVVHIPTVRQACKKYGLMFKSLPRCLFLTRQDLGDVHRVLKNWPERNIKVVMITDGENVGPAGDLGVHAGSAPMPSRTLTCPCQRPGRPTSVQAHPALFPRMPSCVPHRRSVLR